MFHLENEQQIQFYLDTKDQADLDEDQLKVLEAYQKNVYLSRHIELQILDWENSRFSDELGQHQDIKILVTEEIDDVKHKCETTEKNLIALAEYQNSLNEQINELMLFKQPVQSETTYLMLNKGAAAIKSKKGNSNVNTGTEDTSDENRPKITTHITGSLHKSKHLPKSANKASFTTEQDDTRIERNNAYGNIYVAPTSNSQKLTYNAFTKSLYSCDSVRIEHLLKNENKFMIDGLIYLERSIHKILNDIDRDEIDEDTKTNITTVDSLIRKINENDRLSYLTIIEHLNLRKKLFHIDYEKSQEVSYIMDECKLIEGKIKQLQQECQHNLDVMKQRYEQDQENTIKQLEKQKDKLTAKLMFLNKRQRALNHPFARRHQIERQEDLFDNESFHFPGQENNDPNQKKNQGAAGGKKQIKNNNTVAATVAVDVDLKTDLIAKLVVKVTEAKERYKDLERRNRLEMEGYESEIMFLRRKLKNLEKIYLDDKY